MYTYTISNKPALVEMQLASPDRFGEEDGPFLEGSLIIFHYDICFQYLHFPSNSIYRIYPFFLFFCTNHQHNVH